MNCVAQLTMSTDYCLVQGAVRDVDNQGIVPRAITRLGENLARVASEQQGTVFRVSSA